MEPPPPGVIDRLGQRLFQLKAAKPGGAPDVSGEFKRIG